MFTPAIEPAARREIERVEQLVAERDDALAIPRVSAEFLHALVLAGGFRRGLELGTSYGYSGLWLGAALRRTGGVLSTIDLNPEKVAHARAAFDAAGLGDVVLTNVGRIDDLLPRLDGPFDFVFVDADKESSLRYFELLWPQLARHATLVTDNVTSHADALGAYITRLRAHPQLASVLVPIGSGLELSVKMPATGGTASIDGAEWVI